MRAVWKGATETLIFFVAKICHFAIKKKVQSNMIKGIFLKISQKFATFQISYDIAKI
jgi:hypothetical protein